MAGIQPEFAQYCCELLSGVGPCVAKRMFGGWGIGMDGMNIAILANLGDGDTLWLKVKPKSHDALTQRSITASIWLRSSAAKSESNNTNKSMSEQGNNSARP